MKQIQRVKFTLCFAFAVAERYKKSHEDFYKILGLNSSASIEEIKKAFQLQVKKYHPDLNDPSMIDQDYIEKFSDVVEAYEALSNDHTRNLYLQIKTQILDPEKAYQKHIDESRKLRDKTGNIPNPKPHPGCYEEQRLEILKAERKKYNINEQGVYLGGVPQRNMGRVRGKALDEPGNLHTNFFHNSREYAHHEAMSVTTRENILYKNAMNSERYAYDHKHPWLPLEVDPDQKYRKKHTKTILEVFGLILVYPLYLTFKFCKNKLSQYQRAKLLKFPEKCVKVGSVIFKRA